MQFWDSIVRAKHSIHAETGDFALMQEEGHNLLVFLQCLSLRYPQIKVCIPDCTAIALQVHKRVVQVIAYFILSLPLQGAPVIIASAQ